MQLQQKVAALMCENEELVAQKEYSETQSGQVSRNSSLYVCMVSLLHNLFHILRTIKSKVGSWLSCKHS